MGASRISCPQPMTSRPSTVAPILVVLAIVVVIALPMLYVLSVGPLAWLYWHDYIGGETFITFAAPAIRAAEYAGVSGWLNWYVTLWER